jgi:hypothetical protein
MTSVSLTLLKWMSSEIERRATSNFTPGGMYAGWEQCFRADRQKFADEKWGADLRLWGGL